VNPRRDAGDCSGVDGAGGDDGGGGGGEGGLRVNPSLRVKG